MAAVAPPPYRASPSSLVASSASSSTPSRKQENSAAVAAGRRRLEEFKRRKAADKGKKTSAVPASDEPALNGAEGEPDRLSLQSGDPSASLITPVDSNGHASKVTLNNGINAFSAQGPSPSEMAVVSVFGGQHSGPPPSTTEAQWSAGDQVCTGLDVETISGGFYSNDSSSTRAPQSEGVHQPIISFPGTQLGKAETRTGLNATNTTGIAQRTPLVGFSRPVFVHTPPHVGQDISGPLTFAAGQVRAGPTKNSVGLSPSPLIQTSSASQGPESILNPSSQKMNGANLVMLDDKLIPNRSAHEEPVLPVLSELEQESSLFGKAKVSSSVRSSERRKTENESDGVSSTSASFAPSHSSNASSLNIKSESEKGSLYPVVNSSLSSFFPSSTINTSLNIPERSAILHPPFSDTGAPKYLPLPPPLFRPSVASSTFKPEPFLPSVLKNNASSSGFSSSTLSSTLPSTTTFLNDALLRPSAPLVFQFPAPVSAFPSPYENGIAETSIDSIGAVLPRSSTSVGEFSSQPVKVKETVDQSRQSWAPSSGGDDFEMLEQHIEDLTQEKFALQRSLDSARALAETLAQEFSALTEDYNNQGGLVNDLKAETARQQAEIRAQAVVVKNMKAERDKAVQDSSASGERLRALAAEVIDLEEKGLRAKSQELKLKQEMELLKTETESQKRQIFSLDKDRANLKSLIEALQEEKGLLQTQIRKAAAGGSSGDSRHASNPVMTIGSRVHNKADACTSTDDFDSATFVTLGQGSTTGQRSASNNPWLQAQPLEQQHGLPINVSSHPLRPLLSPSHVTEASGSFALPTEGGAAGQTFSTGLRSLSGRGLNLGPLSSVIPPDQAATIENINTLVTELAEEKEALLKALRAESVGAAQLRTLNSELSQKLEIQTQRLELAVAQSMVHGSTPTVESNNAVSRMGPEFVDEGDEVVDRVLGWIMQLFPSNASRRKRL